MKLPTFDANCMESPFEGKVLVLDQYYDAVQEHLPSLTQAIPGLRQDFAEGRVEWFRANSIPSSMSIGSPLAPPPSASLIDDRPPPALTDSLNQVLADTLDNANKLLTTSRPKTREEWLAYKPMLENFLTNTGNLLQGTFEGVRIGRLTNKNADSLNYACGSLLHAEYELPRVAEAINALGVPTEQLEVKLSQGLPGEVRGVS